jgi:hypothetical protein
MDWPRPSTRPVRVRTALNHLFGAVCRILVSRSVKSPMAVCKCLSAVIVPQFMGSSDTVPAVEVSLRNPRNAGVRWDRVHLLNAANSTPALLPDVPSSLRRVSKA